MSMGKVLREIDLEVEAKDMKILREDSQKIVNLLREQIKRDKIEAEVFLGGSFAKETMIKSDFYDVDIFIRFDWRYENLSEMLEKIVSALGKKNKMKVERLHGSRDYFRIIRGNVIFEIIPVTKIKKPKEARNVTDLSYFHVNYVRKQIRKKKIAREVLLAKQFCKAQGVYGAESYINGFSGYALECLVINYGSFEKMLKELVKSKGRLIIDSEKKYKKKEEVLFELNEGKLGSPIILVDPTWKERNALAALSNETFEKFRKSASAFLKKPSKSFFEIKKFDGESFIDSAKKDEEALCVEIETNRQPGDIAGTKLKKFSRYFTREISRLFEIRKEEFVYGGENSAKLYLITRSKGEILKIGPPAKMEKHAIAFRKENKDVFEKGGVLHARIKVKESIKTFVQNFVNKNRKLIEGMTIENIRIKDN